MSEGIIFIEVTSPERFISLILDLRERGIPCRGASDDTGMYMIELSLE